MKGLVTATHRRHYVVLLDDGRTIVCQIRGRSLAIACGDRVEVSLAGDADRIYARGERRARSPAQLLAQVSYCNAELRTGYFREEEEHIAAYLNKRYYRFE